MKYLLLLPLILISGCLAPPFEVTKYVSDGCVKSCQQFVSNNGNTSLGKCLTNEIYFDWVCDVAHNPRIAEDDLPENQCEHYVNGSDHHFVEVTPSCEFIRAQ